MNDRVRDRLVELVRERGLEAVTHDSQRCRAMLRDLVPDDRAEVAVLVAALEEGVVDQLGRTREPELRVDALSQHLVDERGLAAPAARWAVTSWLSAAHPDARQTSPEPAPSRPPHPSPRLQSAPAVPRQDSQPDPTPEPRPAPALPSRTQMALRAAAIGAALVVLGALLEMTGEGADLEDAFLFLLFTAVTVALVYGIPRIRRRTALVATSVVLVGAGGLLVYAAFFALSQDSLAGGDVLCLAAVDADDPCEVISAPRLLEAVGMVTVVGAAGVVLTTAWQRSDRHPS